MLAAAMKVGIPLGEVLAEAWRPRNRLSAAIVRRARRRESIDALVGDRPVRRPILARFTRVTLEMNNAMGAPINRVTDFVKECEQIPPIVRRAKGSPVQANQPSQKSAAATCWPVTNSNGRYVTQVLHRNPVERVADMRLLRREATARNDAVRLVGSGNLNARASCRVGEIHSLLRTRLDDIRATGATD